MHIMAGACVPDVAVGELRSRRLTIFPTDEIFRGKNVIVVGVPAAFTPICSQVHLPQFISLAPQMLAVGFDSVICISTSNPWAMEAWADEIDPQHRLRFVSDGNLEFARACRLLTEAPSFFLGPCLSRFTMTVMRGVVRRLAIEKSPLEVTCSSAEALCETIFAPSLM